MVLLTSRGRTQAKEAGEEIAQMIRPGENVRVYRSPYMRTRQTEEEIRLVLRNHGIKPSVIEEPRLREQDFGNFQNAQRMADIMKERSIYGSFFYRISNGESAADVYDRCASFCNSLYRHFTIHEPDVVILVSHGIWGRVFLMKWFKWNYEYFENLKNLQHCVPIVMERKDSHYALLSDLETWEDQEPTSSTNKGTSPDITTI